VTSSSPAFKTALCLTVALQATAWGYLGSFELADGYHLPSSGLLISQFYAGDAQFYLGNNSANGFTGIVPPGAFPNTMGDMTHGADLSRYNAGQFGTSHGGPGGTAADIPDNSGLWQALAGGRLNEDLGAPYYLGNSFQRDYIAAYGYSNARTGTQVLNVLASDVDLHYRYHFDARDFHGVQPSQTAASLVAVSFWLCPSDYDDGYTDNVLGMAFRDSLGQTLFEIGYTGDNLLQYRVGNAATWTTTTVTAGTQGWSMISLQLDLFSNTVSFSAAGFNDASSSLMPTVSLLNNTSLNLAAADLTSLDWTAVGMVGFKNFFDDFSFSITPVPEPGSALLVLLAAMPWRFLRRRRTAER
jgi:hypothetical protein